MMNLIEIYKSVVESFGDWKSGKWVHYSDSDFLKLSINKQARQHNNVVGIYLFPEDFKPHAFWRKKKYKFIVDISEDMNVLDISNLSRDEVIDILRQLRDQFIKSNPRKFQRPDTAYEVDAIDLAIKRAEKGDDNYVYEWWNSITYLGGAGANKFLRGLGYDAVFDDTKSLHSLEVQLVVLDPRKIEVVDVTDNTISMFEATKKWYDYLLSGIKRIPGVEIVEENDVKKRGSGGGYDTRGDIYFKYRDEPEESYGHRSYGISVGYSSDDKSRIVFSPSKDLYGNPNYSVIWTYDVHDDDAETKASTDDFLKRVSEKAEDFK